MKKILLDNIKVIIAGIAALAVIIALAVILSLAFGGETIRSLTVNDIRGTVVVIRGSKQFYATKKTVLQSGDVVNTDAGSSVRICLDRGKYISIEPESSVYVYYTQIAGKGEISVNIGCGAVISQLNEPLTKKESFYVKTPNTAISVRGTVFRTEFSMKDKFMGYDDVMMTHVQNFGGSVMLQLYDVKGEKTDAPMLLTEKTSAELISCSEFAQYNYLNYDTDMYALDEITVKELIRISGEHPIAYSLDELGIAMRAISRRVSLEALTSSAPEETEETSSAETEPPATTPAETSFTPVTKDTTIGTTASPKQTEEPPAEPGTTFTTMETHIYTTYPGPRWWEMPNNDPYSDDFDYNSYENIITEATGVNAVFAAP